MKTFSNFTNIFYPSKEEIEYFSLGGVEIPSREELNSIDFKVDKLNFILPIKIPEIDNDNNLNIHDICFILKDRLFLIRYDDYLDIDIKKENIIEIYLSICKTIIYKIRSELTNDIQIKISYISSKIFNYDTINIRTHKNSIKMIGKISDYIDSVNLLCLKIKKSLEFLKINYIQNQNEDLEILEREFNSIHETTSLYRTKLGFLLDSTLGFISVDQNNSMKFLTMVSSVLILPTLIAGVFGMNFSKIPGAESEYGFLICSGIIIALIVIPLIVFIYRGWFKS